MTLKQLRINLFDLLVMNRKRRNNVFFKKYSIDNRLNQRTIEKYALVNTQEKYVYFRVPKNANTTVTASLLANKPELNKKGIRKQQFETIYDIGQNEQYLEGFTFFAVTRNPYSRILSVYLQKIRGGGSKSDIVGRELRCNPEEIEFCDFIRYLEMKGPYENGHWLPQHIIIPVQHIPELKLIKFEELNSELHNLFNQIPSAKLITENKHATGADDKQAIFYRKDLYEKVFSIYQLDFELFGYDKQI